MDGHQVKPCTSPWGAALGHLSTTCQPPVNHHLSCVNRLSTACHVQTDAFEVRFDRAMQNLIINHVSYFDCNEGMLGKAYTHPNHQTRIHWWLSTTTPVNHLSATCQPPVNHQHHLSTTSQPHLSTTSHPLVNHLSTTCQPPVDSCRHLSTTCRPPVDLSTDMVDRLTCVERGTFLSTCC